MEMYLLHKAQALIYQGFAPDRAIKPLQTHNPCLIKAPLRRFLLNKNGFSLDDLFQVQPIRRIAFQEQYGGYGPALFKGYSQGIGV